MALLPEKQAWVLLDNKSNYEAFYCHSDCQDIWIRKKGYKWYLYAYDLEKYSYRVKLDFENNTLNAALFAFKDKLLALYRVLPYLPYKLSEGWYCQICGKYLSGPQDIPHVEAHLTMVKSASKA
jgi:hypothetical protein